MFDPKICDEVLCLRADRFRYLSTGIDGGLSSARAIYWYSVPKGWDREDVAVYTEERKQQTGFDREGPSLLTGVSLSHLRGARLDPVEAYVTAGVSNPAALPMKALDESADIPLATETVRPGTVNVAVGTNRSLSDAALAELLGVAVEAKTATLLALTGFPGTTTDATIVASDPMGSDEQFCGSATTVGKATRACVRDAITASLDSRYADEAIPASVAEAPYGIETTARSSVFQVESVQVHK